MRKYNIGDKVICVKFDVENIICFDSQGITHKNQINTFWFNREAIINNTYKKYMESILRSGYEDKAEYEIKFIDNGEIISWIPEDELIPLNIMKMDTKINKDELWELSINKTGDYPPCSHDNGKHLCDCNYNGRCIRKDNGINSDIVGVCWMDKGQGEY